jgi:hypothetical protein
MAKANGIPREALLTHIKAAWSDAALARGYPSRSDWYGQLVMHCLEEYYSPLVSGGDGTRLSATASSEE